MSEPKHTPGPWHTFGTHVAYVNGMDVSEMTYGRKIAELGKPGTERWADEIVANARLIAAAPELLAACEQSLKWLKIDRDAGLISDDVYHVRRETIIAAVHKATKGE